MRRRLVTGVVLLLVLSAGVALALAAVGGVASISDPLTASVFLTVESPDPFATVSNPLTRVNGRVRASWPDGRIAFPGTSVVLLVNGGEVASGLTDADGAFHFSQIALRKGDNQVRLEATSQVGWRRFELPPFQFPITFTPTIPTMPTLDAPLPTSSLDHVRLQGAADPAVTVVVQRALLPSDPTSGAVTSTQLEEVARVPTDRITGRFTADVSVYPPGTYELSVFAVNAQDAKSSRTAPVRVTYDPAALTTESVHRHLSLTLAPTTVRATFEVTLPKADPRAQNLVYGRATPDQFFDQVFGPLQVDDYNLSNLFAGSQATKKVSGDSVQVTAQSNPELGSRPWTAHFSAHVTEGTYLSGADDSFTLRVNDYNLQAVSPEPTSLVGGVATWEGPIGLTDAYLTADLDPWSASPLAIMRLRPYDLIPWPAAAPLGLLYAFMNALALIWYAWLRHRWRGSRPDEMDSGFLRLSRWLVAVCFVPAVVDLARAAIDPGHRLLKNGGGPLEPLLDEPYRIALAVLVALAVLATLANLPFRRPAERPLTSALALLVQGFALAMWMAAAAVAVIVLWWATPLSIDYRLLAFLLTAALVAPLVLATTRLALATYAPKWNRPRVWLPIALAAAAVCWPVATTGFKVDGLGYPDSAANAITSAFLQLQYYAAFSVLIPIGAVLRDAGAWAAAPAATKQLVIGFALLIFANLLINVDPYFLGLPLSFLLALFLFPRLLLIPEGQLDPVLKAAPLVRRRRNSLLKQLDTATLARQLNRATESLIKKVMAGDLTATQFKSQMRALQGFASPGSRRPPSVRGRPGPQSVLAYGPLETDWADGIYAARIALLVALPWILLYFAVFAFRAGQLSTPVIPLVLAGSVLSEPFVWALQGFFFGYYFAFIRGGTGLRKGLRAAFVYSLCMAPLWLTSFRNTQEALSTALAISTVLLSFTVIGLWFDLKTLKRGLADRFGLDAFGRWTGLASITAFGSVIAATLGVALSSVLSGEFVTLAGALLHAAGAPPLSSPGH